MSGPAARAVTMVMMVVLVAAPSGAPGARCIPVDDPFAVINPQNWVNPDNMTWDDLKAPPGTSWGDPRRRGSVRNFNIALVAVDYDDKPFAVTQAAYSTIYGNPLPVAANMAREDVPSFYRDLLNKPTGLNHGHTLHEYWMGDSAGRFGVYLTAFGAYRLPGLSYQYGIDKEMNPGACPPGAVCDLDIRDDALGLWRRDVGDGVADSFELVFVLSAGQDESSTWQEFGEMKFASKDVPDSFGPPGSKRPNYATTRYVEWTSWAAASNLWPNAGRGSSTQCESSGMGTYAHELSHLLNISDNYNNPYGRPLRRAYTGPWSMLSRGAFNGPGGPHSRWHIPALQGGSLGSLHTMRDRHRLGLVGDGAVLRLSREALAASGSVVASITARAVDAELMGVRVELGAGLAPSCDVAADVLCDGGAYDSYEMEVVDRMGADSFQPDAGVMVSKTKDADQAPFQWTVDANPPDIGLVDFYRPDGTAVMATRGDYRQLADALFHAGTRSGSRYEFVDEPNGLHLYVLDRRRDPDGVLSYSLGARSLGSTAGSEHGAQLSPGRPAGGPGNTPTGKGVLCRFGLTNNGTYSGRGKPPRRLAPFLGSDIYRLGADVRGAGWRVEVSNALAAARFGETVAVAVAVAAAADAVHVGIVTLTASSESDPRRPNTRALSARAAIKAAAQVAAAWWLVASAWHALCWGSQDGQRLDENVAQAPPVGRLIEVHQIVVTLQQNQSQRASTRHDDEKARLLDTFDRGKGRWDDYHPRHRLLEALHGFLSYRERQAAELSRLRGLYKKVSKAQKAFLEHHLAYSSKFDRVEEKLVHNQALCDEIVHSALSFYGVDMQELQKYVDDTEAAGQRADKTSESQALKHIVRDWTEEGQHERNSTFACMLHSLDHLFPGRRVDTEAVKILLPGAGLGRLEHDIHRLGGFDVTINEWSMYMNVVYRFLQDQWSRNGRSLHSFVDNWSHHASDSDMLRQPSFPDVDVDPQSVLMIEGDFTAVFRHQERFYDVVLIYFFIDTARNLMSYFDTIKKILKPGGFWINLGPLLYGTCPFVQLSLQDIVKVTEAMGFQFLDTDETCGRPTFEGPKVRGMEAIYGFDKKALTKNSYDAQFWVAKLL